MRYKRFRVAKTTTVQGRIDIHQVTIEIEKHIPHDATYNDLVSDSIMNNYYMMGKRAPAGLGSNSMFGAIKRAFCKAIMDIEIER